MQVASNNPTSRWRHANHSEGGLNHKTLIDSIPLGFVHGKLKRHGAETVDCYFLTVNKLFEKIVGFKEQEIREKLFSEFIPSIFIKSNWVKKIADVIDNAGDNIFLEYSTVNQRYFEVTIKENENDCFYLFFKDVTENQNVLRKISSSEKLLSIVIDNTQFGMSLIGPHGYPLFVNKKISEVLDYSIERLMELSFEEITHPEDLESSNFNIRRLEAREIDFFHQEKRYLKSDGSVIYAKTYVTIVDDAYEGTSCLLAVIEDITKTKTLKLERDRIAKKAAKDNEIMQEMAKVAAIGSWELDLKSGKTTWSDAIFDIHEIDQGTSSELLDAIDFYHPEDRVKLKKVMNKAIKENGSWDEELRAIMVNSGKEKWVRVIGKPVIVDRELIALRGIIQDIDEKKRGELETLEAKKELESFAYSVSHDLRAPLRAINGFASVLKEELNEKLSETGEKYLSRIVINGEKMDQFIDGLLEYSRLKRESIDNGKLDLNALIEVLVEEIFYEYKDSIELGKLPMVWGDKGMLSRLFMNLISNAIKYSSKKDIQKIRISSKEEETSVIIVVEDNGVGFDMSFADKLFMIFQRLHSDEEFEGTGIGLSICSKIVTVHHGEIWATARPNEGASFFVRLPK